MTIVVEKALRESSESGGLDVGPIKVLVVDDEAWHRELLGELLPAPRFELHEAPEGLQALEMISRQEFDAVLLDDRMPGLSGEEVCRRIRQDVHRPFLPIIMVTGCDSQQDLTRCLAAGATDYISKPYSHSELISRLHAAVRQKRMVEQLDSVESAMFALARMVEARDAGTGDHCNRLVNICALFGRKLGLDDGDLLSLCRGAILHDIGKVAVPDHILLKTGPLTKEEWDVMKSHTIEGARLLTGLASMRRVVPIVRSHHERWDGSGYPDGLKGQDIPYLARVFQLADIFDALTHARSYKPEFPLGRVVATLEKDVALGYLDPELTAAMLDLIAVHYNDMFTSPGTLALAPLGQRGGWLSASLPEG